MKKKKKKGKWIGSVFDLSTLPLLKILPNLSCLDYIYRKGFVLMFPCSSLLNQL